MAESTKSILLTPGGEGSKHLMVSEKPFEVIRHDDQTFEINLKHKAEIKHTEHGHMHLEPGKYFKTNQVEFNPFTQTVSYVFD
jgi:hypothetical protein